MESILPPALRTDKWPQAEVPIWIGSAHAHDQNEPIRVKEQHPSWLLALLVKILFYSGWLQLEFIFVRIWREVTWGVSQCRKKPTFSFKTNKHKNHSWWNCLRTWIHLCLKPSYRTVSFWSMKKGIIFLLSHSNLGGVYHSQFNHVRANSYWTPTYLWISQKWSWKWNPGYRPVVIMWSWEVGDKREWFRERRKWTCKDLSQRPKHH